MKRVLHLLNYPGHGGSEKYIEDIISGLEGTCKFYFASSMDGPLCKRLQELNVPLYRLPMRHPLNWRAARSLSHLLREMKIDIIHTHYLRENMIALLSRRFGGRAGVIWTYHVNVPMPAPVCLLNRIFTPCNKHIIAVSEFMKGELVKRGIPEQKIKVVYNGIRQEESTGKALSRPQSDTPNTGPTVFAVIGRLSPEKGQSFLLDALAQLEHLSPGTWECRIIGDGPDRVELEEKTKNLGLASRVKFLGYQSPVAPFYREADCIIIPSANESLSYVAIEALMHLRPVIATRVGGIPEVIRDQKTGLLVPYGDAEQLALKMQKFISCPKTFQAYQEAGYNYAAKHFSLAQMLQKIAALYQA